jgi:hypothetical protein
MLALTTRSIPIGSEIAALLDPSCDQELPHVPLHVLGRMKQESYDGRRQLLPPDNAHFVQNPHWRRTQLTQRTVDLSVECAEQLINIAARFRQLPFAVECVTLLTGQRLASRICEQAIDYASDVLQVKADRRDSSWTYPQQLFREILQQPPGFFACLQQRVSDRLQGIGHASDRTPKPCLW